jgi:TrmH family RNA methyltransferase
VWVDPRVVDLEPARRLAVHAAELLRAAGMAPSLDAAVADCVWVVGTSSRKVEGKRRLNPREAAHQLIGRAAQGSVALVFGDERNGLSNAEVARCHALSAAPTRDEQSSLNLAQAVLLYSYELRMAQLAAASHPTEPLPVAATDAEVRHVETALRCALEKCRFLVSDERHAVRDLMAPLVRSHLSRRETQLWLAALHSVLRCLRTPV